MKYASLKKSSKRALSGVLTQVLLILIGLALVAIIFAVIRLFIAHQQEYTEKAISLSAKEFRINNATVTQTNPTIISIILSQSQGIEVVITNGSSPETSPIPLDIVSVVDASTSMSTDQVNGIIKFDLLKNVSKDFNNKTISNTNGRMGLVSFAQTTLTTFAFSRDLTALNNRVNTWTTQIYTCLCCGINSARTMFGSSPAGSQKAMIVMTDGESNVACPGSASGPSTNPNVSAIQSACNAYGNLSNLTIYTVGFGVPTPYIDILKNVSSKCGKGTYFDANSATDFISAYNQINNIITQKYLIQASGDFLLFVFTDKNDQTYSEKVYDLPLELLGSKNYNFTIPTDLGDITEIDVYPGSTLSYGGDVYSWKASYWKFYY